MLQLHLVTVHGRQLGGNDHTHADSAHDRIAMHEQGHIPDYACNTQGRSLELTLFDEGTNLPDNFACAVIVLDKVMQYLAHLRKVDRLCRQEALRCLRVA